MARYRLTEPFYDNLVLWEEGEEIEFDGTPSPSMIPLDAEAKDKMAEYCKERGEVYTPPLSELADTMDGKRTVADFHPGGRGKKSNVVPPFPVIPGRPDSKIPAAASRVADASKSAAPNIPPMSQMPQMPVKPAKNFDRAPR